jgi:hypothetical protein
LSGNPAAIDLLRANPHKINWFMFSQNPAIFEYDYDRMLRGRLRLHEDLMAAVFHPRRLAALLDADEDADENNPLFM